MLYGFCHLKTISFWSLYYFTVLEGNNTYHSTVSVFLDFPIQVLVNSRLRPGLRSWSDNIV